MRTRLRAWEGGLAALLLAAVAVVVLTVADQPPVADTAGAATVPTRTCATRGEGTSPSRRFPDPGSLRIGPVAFSSNLRRAASPRAFDQFLQPRTGRYVLKAPVNVRAGRVVTVSIAPEHRSVAGLAFTRRGPVTGRPAVRFHACDRDEPAFAHDGPVGVSTFFPGGFTLEGPACVQIVVRERGRRAPYRRTVPFGTRRCD